MNALRFFVLTVALAIFVCPANAIVPIPEESGFSGFVSLGASVMSMESNLISGNDLGELGQEVIPSIHEKPDSETSVSSAINGDLRYTFGSTRTQIHAGTMLEDFIRFDFSTLLGVRQIVPGVGIVGASYVFSGIPTEVWEDPYLENTNRTETDRDSSGARLSWERIFGTMFQARYMYRNNEIENELSGSDPSIVNPDEARLLDRNGNVHSAEIAYLHIIEQGHFLNPSMKYIRHEMDGDARSKDQLQVKLTHTIKLEKFLFNTNATFGISEYDEVNPIYAKKQKNKNFGLALNLFYLKPFNLEKWSIMTVLAGYKETSNIDFYEGQVSMLNVSAVYRF